jgi:hypothetical protein
MYPHTIEPLEAVCIPEIGQFFPKFFAAGANCSAIGAATGWMRCSPLSMR